VARPKTEFKPWYLSIFGIFYLGQGYSLGSLVLLLPLYMFEELEVATPGKSAVIAAVILIPWYVKILFGIVSDNFNVGKFGRRKPYLVIATLISAFGWLILPIPSEVNFLFILAGFGISTGSALGDSVIDGMAVELTPTNYIGRIQGVAWGSRGIGLGLAGFVSTTIVESFGWIAMIYFAAVFGIGITIITLILPQKRTVTTQSIVEGLKGISKIFANFGKKGSYARSGYFLFSGMCLAIIPLLPFIMRYDYGFSLRLVGIGSLLFAISNGVGSLLMGLIFDQKETLSRIYSMFILTALSFISGVFIFYFFDGVVPIILAYIMFVGFTMGLFEAYQLKIVQENSPEEVEGTAFALWTGVSNIGQFSFGAILANLVEINLSLLFSKFPETTNLIAILGFFQDYRLSYIETTYLILIPLILSLWFISKFKSENKDLKIL
jgi:MFS family permease